MTGGLPCLGLRGPWLSGGTFRLLDVQNRKPSTESVIYVAADVFGISYAAHSF